MLVTFGDPIVCKPVADVGGGVLVLIGVRSEAWRELVRDMLERSFAASRSLSRRSATSFSRVETSTGLAAPKGFALLLELEVGGVGPILGEESGLGVAEALPDRGRSSSFRRLIWGVGGVELLGDMPLGPPGLDRAELLQSPSSPL